MTIFPKFRQSIEKYLHFKEICLRLKIFLLHQLSENAMISILAQERLLGVALGTVFTGVVVFAERKRIYESIAETHSQFSPQSQLKEPVFEKKSGLELAHIWNRAVDKAFGPVIESLSSRGW